MLELLIKQYARLKGTKVLAQKLYGNRITFVLESGHKLDMSAEELQAEIDAMQSARKVSEPFEYIEEAVKDLEAERKAGLEAQRKAKAEEKARLKAEAKAKKEAEKAGKP